MATEIMRNSRQITNANQLDLEWIDIWALVMLLQCLVSPDTCPFTQEVADLQRCGGDLDSFISNMYILKRKPSITEKYLSLRLMNWSSLFIACDLCTSFEPFSRPTASQVSNFLARERGNCIQLKVSQGSALETKDKSMAQALANGDAIEYCDLPNEGTNSCAFLCLKLADMLSANEFSSQEHLCKAIEDVICNYPSILNPFRDIDETYDVL